MTQTTALTIEETGDTVIIKRDGVEIDLGPDHSVVVHSDGDVKLQPVPANDTTITAAKTALEVGDKMADGTIYAGISPDTNRPMYAVPIDAPVSMDFNEAAKYAKSLRVGDKKDFRVPTKAELNTLFQNREKGALKGTFNVTGSDPSGWYWSGTPHGGYNAYGQRFSDGRQVYYGRYVGSSVRCVR